MIRLGFKLMKAGYCKASEKYAIKGGTHKDIAFDAVFALLSHPIHGYILFDTGYSQRFYNETQKFPGKLYAKITKVYIEQKEEAVNQLKSAGIEPEDIKHIIVSHFHADHIGGLRDFPDATIYCSKKAISQINGRNGFAAVRRGILKGLLPDNLDKRAVIIEAMHSKEHPILGVIYDLFEDGSIQMIDLSGHAAGQMGALIKTEEKEIFMIADACWLKSSYQQNITPNPRVRFVFDSWTEFKSNLEKVHLFYLNNPNVLIVPTHCNETTTQIIKSQFE